MSEGAAQQESPREEAKRAEAGEQTPGSAEALGAIEQQIVQRVERTVRAVGAGARRVRAALRERAAGSESKVEPGRPGSAGQAELFHVPEEVRGLVERYPIPAMLASCGAGYLLGALVTGRRRQ